MQNKDIDTEQIKELMHIVDFETSKPYETCLYFDFLKKYKAKDEVNIISDINFNTLYNIKNHTYYDMISFKVFVCELFYQAVQYFPNILEYDIIIKNNKVETLFRISSIMCDTYDDQGHRGYALITNQFETYILNKYDMFNLYQANRTSNSRSETAVALVMLLWRDGDNPTVTTSYKLNPSFIKNCKKN